MFSLLPVSGLDFVDFDVLTKDEIKAYLKRKELERIRKMKLAEHIIQEQKKMPLLESVLTMLEYNGFCV